MTVAVVVHRKERRPPSHIDAAASGGDPLDGFGQASVCLAEHAAARPHLNRIVDQLFLSLAEHNGKDYDSCSISDVGAAHTRKPHTCVLHSASDLGQYAQGPILNTS